MTQLPRRLFLLAAALALLIGCDPGTDMEPPGCTSDVPPEPEAGIGDLVEGFKPLDDGEVIEAIMGPQGLHMLEVSLRVNDFVQPRVPGMHLAFETEARFHGQVVAGATGNDARPVHDGDRIEYLGIRVTFAKDDAAAKYADQLLDVDIRMRDGCYRLLEARRKWRVHFPIVNPADRQ